jgi:hypothetical protein
MPRKAKVVLTDYVWDSLAIEHRVLDGVANLVPFESAAPDDQHSLSKGRASRRDDGA